MLVSSSGTTWADNANRFPCHYMASQSQSWSQYKIHTPYSDYKLAPLASKDGVYIELIGAQTNLETNTLPAPMNAFTPEALLEYTFTLRPPQSTLTYDLLIEPPRPYVGYLLFMDCIGTGVEVSDKKFNGYDLSHATMKITFPSSPAGTTGTLKCYATTTHATTHVVSTWNSMSVLNVMAVVEFQDPENPNRVVHSSLGLRPETAFPLTPPNPGLNSHRRP